MDALSRGPLELPGAVSVSRLRVYGDLDAAASSGAGGPGGGSGSDSAADASGAGRLGGAGGLGGAAGAGGLGGSGGLGSASDVGGSCGASGPGEVGGSVDLDAAGGTPHVHLVSAEAYVVIAGRGSVQTLDVDGFRETPLAPGTVVAFGPGTIHRLVNAGGLEIVTIMQNAGLPESGDAVMTFLPEILSDPEAYRRAADLPSRGADVATRAADLAARGAGVEARGADLAARGAEVAARRSAALRGWRLLVEASERGEAGPLRAFYRAASELVRSSAPGWRAIVEDAAPRQLERARTALAAILDGDTGPLELRTLAVSEPDSGGPAWGMCGRLTTWQGR